MKKIRVSRIDSSINYSPHIGQVYAHKNLKRFNILDCGRRFGKNHFASREEWIKFCQPKTLVWHVGPTYDVSSIGWDLMHLYARRANQKKRWININKAEKKLEGDNGSIFQCKTADNPTSLLGRGPDFIVIDEMARIGEEVWQQALRPSLMVSKGIMLGLSTPRGKNHFYKLFLRGQDPRNKEYFSMRAPSWVNPLVDKGEVREMYRSLPEDIFRQEVMADFIDDAGSVFRNIEKCATGEESGYVPGRNYVFACDLAKKQDFTVIMVGDVQTRSVVYFERFNHISWPMQLQRIKNAVSLYGGCSGIIDSTGLGDVIYDDLVHSGINVTPFNFGSPGEKNRIIENLSSQMDKCNIHYPSHGNGIEVLKDELSIYEYEIMPSTGKFRYNAPFSYHDDTVVTLAMLNEKMDSSSFVYTFGSKSRATFR